MKVKFMFDRLYVTTYFVTIKGMIVYVNDLQMVGTYRCPPMRHMHTHTHTHTRTHTHTHTHKTHTQNTHTLCIIAVLALRWNLPTSIVLSLFWQSFFIAMVRALWWTWCSCCSPSCPCSQRTTQTVRTPAP